MRSGLEFTAYHRAGLLNEIRHRMNRAGVVGFPAYQAYLAANPEEYRRLCQLICVHRTEFFRDPDDWAYLAAEVVPRILTRKAADEPVRAWSAGCATGEEAYTLAIVLAEAMGLDAFAQRVQVFATDVNQQALAAARTGRYRAERMAGVPPDLRERYFRPNGLDWEVRRDLRACIVFGQLDLLGDPPLSQLDLIACRNTLIYFSPEAQTPILAGLYLVESRKGSLCNWVRFP
jgi:two-component system CheB/CheR fusion protein